MPTGRRTCNDVAYTCHRSLDAACSTTFICFWHFWFGQARCVDAVPFAHAVGNFSTGRIGRKPSKFPHRHPLVIQYVTMENALNNVFVLTGLQTRMIDWCSFISYLVDGFQMF